jgi:hypothetical protein
METIMDFLVRNLKEAGAKRWVAIASQINSDHGGDKPIVGEPLLRKIAYGDRSNPGVETVQPIVDYFHQIERGERCLPDSEAAPQKEAA